MLRKVIKFALLALLGLFILGLPLGWEAIKILPLGWLNFLHRTLPTVSMNGSGIGMVVLCSALLVGCAHWLCRWLYRAISPEGSRPWLWRWTFALFAFFWITFGIVIGAAGAARQIKWLAQMERPFYKERVHYYSDLRHAALEFGSLTFDAKGDVSHVQKQLLANSYRGGALGTLDRYQYIFLTSASNGVESAIIVPRDPEAQRRVGFVVSSNPGENIPIDRLPAYILSK